MNAKDLLLEPLDVTSRARVINSSWFSCFFVGFFFRPDYQSPTRSAVAVGEIILLLLKIFVGWELVVYPSNTHVFPVVASLCHTGNTSFAGYQLLCVKK